MRVAIIKIEVPLAQRVQRMFLRKMGWVRKIVGLGIRLCVYQPVVDESVIWLLGYGYCARYLHRRRYPRERTSCSCKGIAQPQSMPIEAK